jgi:tRNA (uracil-5-)-methyltransferase
MWLWASMHFAWSLRSCLNLTTPALHRQLPELRVTCRSIHQQSTYSPGPFLGPPHPKSKMAEIGQVRAPSPPSGAPAAKKPRLAANKGSGPARTTQSKSQKRRAQYNSLPELCSPEDVLWREIKGVLGEDYVDAALADGTDRQSPFEYHQELELQVVAACSTGVSFRPRSQHRD